MEYESQGTPKSHLDDPFLPYPGFKDSIFL